MNWTPEAEAAIKKVPFFVRKRVKSRVEKEAAEQGKSVITLVEVKSTQQKFLTGMSKEVKGYQLDACFGQSGCPNRAVIDDKLLPALESMLQKENLLDFLKKNVKGELKFHHEFRVTLADCPNACSQPQIKDVGIIGAVFPVLTEEICTQCDTCVASCKEEAIHLDPADIRPIVAADHCIACGQCVRACPTGTLAAGKEGYRIQLGGKLGRRPRLARELPGIYNMTTVLDIVQSCIAVYKERSRDGERFADLMTPSLFQSIAAQYRNHKL
ncbi:MAG: 4Fe-4S binding protein [Desulfobacteraceae bacterium]|nr:4Fe-4S binding protein [Desulfobacteraceae bacterium]